jgi:hypothetical protein
MPEAEALSAILEQRFQDIETPEGKLSQEIIRKGL